jgi:hypothetical protein
MLVDLSVLFISAASIIFSSRRLSRYSYHFQAVKYSRRSFKNWIIEDCIFDKKGTLIVSIAAASLQLVRENELLSAIVCTLGAVCLIWLGFWEQDPRKVGTLMLQETDRSISMYNLALGLYSIFFTFSICSIYIFTRHNDLALYWFAVIVGIQSAPIWLIMAKTLQKTAAKLGSIVN